MKKIISLVMALVLCVAACFSLASCNKAEADAYTVGICQLMEHESLTKQHRALLTH